MDETLIDEFRRWSALVPVIVGKKNPAQRDRAPGTTEGSVGALAAAINLANQRKDTLHGATFSAMPPASVSRTPTYRSDVAEIAAMFCYCLHPEPPKGEFWSEKMRERHRLHRDSLLCFLRVSVATWCRPDAAYDLSTDPARGQWIAAARVVMLNQKGRRQTKKYRPAVPAPRQFVRVLERTNGFVVPVKSVRKAFEAMLGELGLPRDRETGQKLIRRSMAQIARKRMGEERWRQGEMMLGHAKASISDLYALPDPANLGIALATTEAIIDEIEIIAPGAFTGATPELRLVVNG